MQERIVPQSIVIAALRMRLLAVHAVVAVHLVETSTANAGLVAYVVGGQRKVLEAAIAAAMVDVGQPDLVAQVALVRVHALPLRADGSIDDHALAMLPAWTEAALPLPVAYRPVQPVRRRIHLSDLLPDHPLLSPSIDDIAVKRTQQGGTAAKPAHSRLQPLILPPDMPASLAAALMQAAQNPELGIIHVAADMSELRVSYAELYDEARRILGGLYSHGVKRGDVVLVDSGDSRSLLPLFWACLLGAIVPAPFKISAAAGGGAALKRLRDSWEVLGRPLIAADPASLQALAPLRAQPTDGLEAMVFLDAAALSGAASATPAPATDLGALAMVFMTSGSTGLPKGVMLSQANVLAMIAGVAERGAALRPGATSMNWMPLDHVGGLGFLSILPLVLGMNQVQVDTATVLAAPLRWLDLVHRHRVCVVWTPNFALDVLLQAAAAPGVACDWDLSSLEMIVNGGETVSDSVLAAFSVRFAPNRLPTGALWPSFGMTETVSGFSMSQWAPGNGEMVSLGVPIRGAAHRIVDQHGAVVAEGAIGAVELSGQSLFIGYFGRDDLLAESMHGNWFRTGDMGFLRNEELFVVGRIKEMIIVNGANFYSAEIEEVAIQVAGVERLSVAAIGVRAPGARTDQVALFFHAPEAGNDIALRRVMQEIRMRIGRHLSLTPAYFIHVPPERLPRTNSGKIQRIELQRQIQAGVFDVEIKQAACLLESPGTIPRWFAEPFWKPGANVVRTSGDNGRRRRIAVLCSAGDARIRAALTGAAVDIDWDPLSVDGYANVLQLADVLAAMAPADVLLVLPGLAHLPGMLLLCQALSAMARGKRPARLVVCGAAEDVGEVEEHAAVAAFLRSAAAEIDGMQCTHIQFAGTDLRHDAAMILGDLRGAESGSAFETDLLYVDGQRHVRRWRDVELAKAEHPALRRGGLYLLSGGLGGVGLFLARHLLDQHDARLLIVGRTPPALLDDARTTALRELECSGRVLYANVDVADLDTLRAAVEQACARWQCGLDGVMHLAGEGRLVALGSETAAMLAQTMHAKVAGSRALLELLAGHPEAWFVLVGSVAGMVAGRQDAAYAAANAYQAALAERLAAAGHTRCRYLGFSSWRHTGLSKQGGHASALQAAGYFSMEPEYAVASLEIALSMPVPALAIGLDLQHARLAALQDAAAAVDEPVLFQVGVEADTRMTVRDHFGRDLPLAVLNVEAIPRDASGAIDRDQLARIAGGFSLAGQPGSEFERYMLQLWKQVLDLPACGVRDDFFALGGNSLRAAQIAASTRERLRLDVAMPDLLQHPTVTEFCAYALQREGKPGITEAIARRLFEIERMTPEQKAARVAARTV